MADQSEHRLNEMDFATQPNMMNRYDLIQWLLRWRMERGGSVSEYNYGKLLETRRTPELRMIVRNICQTELWWQAIQVKKGNRK